MEHEAGAGARAASVGASAAASAAPPLVAPLLVWLGCAALTLVALGWLLGRLLLYLLCVKCKCALTFRVALWPLPHLRQLHVVVEPPDTGQPDRCRAEVL